MDPADRFFASLDLLCVFERFRILVRALPPWRLILVLPVIFRDERECFFEAISLGASLYVIFITYTCCRAIGE